MSSFRPPPRMEPHPAAASGAAETAKQRIEAGRAGRPCVQRGRRSMHRRRDFRAAQRACRGYHSRRPPADAEESGHRRECSASHVVFLRPGTPRVQETRGVRRRDGATRRPGMSRTTTAPTTAPKEARALAGAVPAERLARARWRRRRRRRRAALVRMKPEGSLSPGVTNLAMMPATNPMMIVQINPIVSLSRGARAVQRRCVTRRWQNAPRRLTVPQAADLVAQLAAPLVLRRCDRGRAPSPAPSARGSRSRRRS